MGFFRYRAAGRRARRLFGAIVALTIVGGLLFSQCGCATVPPERAYVNAQHSLATTLNLAADAYEAGILDEEDLYRVYGCAKLARRALAEWALALRDGEAPDDAIARFRMALRALKRALENAGEAEEAEDGPDEDYSAAGHHRPVADVA